jgi:hypothetical protein
MSHMQVLISITTDSSGVVRVAVLAPSEIARVNADPTLRLFANRAMRAVFDPNCAHLPLPPALLGQRRVFTFRFAAP